MIIEGENFFEKLFIGYSFETNNFEGEPKEVEYIKLRKIQIALHQKKQLKNIDFQCAI